MMPHLHNILLYHVLFTVTSYTNPLSNHSDAHKTQASISKKSSGQKRPKTPLINSTKATTSFPHYIPFVSTVNFPHTQQPITNTLLTTLSLNYFSNPSPLT